MLCFIFSENIICQHHVVVDLLLNDQHPKARRKERWVSPIHVPIGLVLSQVEHFFSHRGAWKWMIFFCFNFFRSAGDLCCCCFRTIHRNESISYAWQSCSKTGLIRNEMNNNWSNSDVTNSHESNDCFIQFRTCFLIDLLCLSMPFETLGVKLKILLSILHRYNMNRDEFSWLIEQFFVSNYYCSVIFSADERVANGEDKYHQERTNILSLWWEGGDTAFHLLNSLLTSLLIVH